jgi:hypothetical protein
VSTKSSNRLDRCLLHVFQCLVIVHKSKDKYKLRKKWGFLLGIIQEAVSAIGERLRGLQCR